MRIRRVLQGGQAFGMVRARISLTGVESRVRGAAARLAWPRFSPDTKGLSS
jgi:hypothetical protein